MADSWTPQRSRMRKLQAQQTSNKVFSVGGRVRRAAPVPHRVEIEFPPFNMHVASTPPDDVYLGRYWFDESKVGQSPGPLKVWTGSGWSNATAH